MRFAIIYRPGNNPAPPEQILTWSKLRGTGWNGTGTASKRSSSSSAGAALGSSIRTSLT